MPSFTDVASAAIAAASDIQQIIDALKGTSGKGVPIIITAVNDAVNWALDLKNNEATNSRALRVRRATDAVLLQVDKDGVQASPDGSATASPVLTASAAQSVSGAKTFTSTVSVTQAAAGTALDLENDDAGAAGVVVTALHASASPASNDVLLDVRSSGKDDAGTTVQYGGLQVVLGDPDHVSGPSADVNILARIFGTLRQMLSTGYTYGLAADLWKDYHGFYLTQHDPGATGVVIAGTHDSATPAALDTLLDLQAWGNDSGANATQYGSVRFILTDPTNGSEDAQYQVQAAQAGAMTTMFTVDANGFIISGDRALQLGTSAGAAPTGGGALEYNGNGHFIRVGDGTNSRILAQIGPARKTADTARTSASLSDDPHMTVPVLANQPYEFEALLYVDGATAGDLQVAMVSPASPTLLQWFATGQGSGATTAAGSPDQGLVSGTGTAKTIGLIGVGSKLGILIKGTFVNGSNAGNLKLQWALASASGTTTIYAGSYLKLTQVE